MALELDSRNNHSNTGIFNDFLGFRGPWNGYFRWKLNFDNLRSLHFLYTWYYSTLESEMSRPSSLIYNESYLNFGCGPFINRRIQPKGCRIFLFDITTSTADSLGREYLGEIRKGNQLWTRQLRYWALVRYCQDASALHIPEPYLVTYRTALVSFHFKCKALHFSLKEISTTRFWL